MARQDSQSTAPFSFLGGRFLQAAHKGDAGGVFMVISSR